MDIGITNQLRCLGLRRKINKTTIQYVSIEEECADGITWQQVAVKLENEKIIVVSPEKYIDNPPWQKIYEGFVRQVEYIQSIIDEQKWFRDTILLVKLNGKKE